MTRAEAREVARRATILVEAAQKAVEEAQAALSLAVDDLERAQTALLDTLRDA